MDQITKHIIYTVLLYLIVPSETTIPIVRSRRQARGLKLYMVDFIGLAEENGYTAERHTVTTEDGYILTLFRLLPNTTFYSKSERRPVVYLHPGLPATADIYVLFGRKRSIAYSLSDAGYDVWLGNVRGTLYSRKHRTLSATNPRFWDFSMDDWALKDIPAMIDYVLERTGRSSLTYAGISLSTTLNIILLSSRPEYNDKINLVVHFAPVAFWESANFVTSLLSAIGKLVEPLATEGAFETIPQTEVAYFVINFFCRTNQTTRALCLSLIDACVGRDLEQFDLTDDEILEAVLHYPAGSSAKAVFHYLQHARTGKFRFYDYGNAEINQRYYGQMEPPDYNISNIAAPLMIFHGTQDPLSTAADDRVLLSKLPRSTTVIYDSVDNYGHIDFLIAKNVQERVYDKIIATLPKFNP